MKHIEKYLALAALLFAVGFNLWLYRFEPTAKIDPNDNPFQYALVDRTNQIWNFADRNCPSLVVTSIPCHIMYMADHWVPNWAQGYNLPYYYSHVPQIAIVISYRLLHIFAGNLTLFQHYHNVIYLLLCIFPLSVFAALRVSKRSWMTASIGALIASQLSTDGLYGLDPSSFLWRGYGLSSQLFAMVFFPVAIAYAYRYFIDKQDEERLTKQLFNANFFLAVLFITLTTMGHLGVGIMALLSTVMIAISEPVRRALHFDKLHDILIISRVNIMKLALVGSSVIFLLSYWILPILLDGNYHNNSFWDPIWKFNSYPWKETLTRLFNGDLYDFGRLPILTGLVLVGICACLRAHGSQSTAHSKDESKIDSEPSTVDHPLFPFAILFVGWLLFYFGRTTWGGLIDLIPGMRDFHLSRFIVGLHIAGLFLVPLAIESIVAWITNKTAKKITFPLHIPLFIIFAVGLVCLVYPQTMKYSARNDELIVQSGEKVATQWDTAQDLIDTLKGLPPGRVFAGRGGAWGKNLLISETPYFMHLSTYGIPTVLWLPETWSPNSDTEQYFIEDRAELYDLYNIRYVVTPPEIEAQPFWKLLKKNDTWSLYEVKTSGYITTGSHAAVVHSSKDNFINVVRLWIQSVYPKARVFPTLSFDKLAVNKYHLPTFSMTDEATYKTLDDKSFSLFGTIPTYEADNKKISIVSPPNDDSDMIFTTTVNVPDGCKNCLVILKQTYHPSWHAYVDGKEVETLITFPFYTAIRLNTPEDHTVQFSYEPSGMKKILLLLSSLTIVGVVGFLSRPAILKLLKNNK